MTSIYSITTVLDQNQGIYRITAVTKVKTDIVTIIASDLIGQSVLLVFYRVV